MVNITLSVEANEFVIVGWLGLFLLVIWALCWVPSNYGRKAWKLFKRFLMWLAGGEKTKVKKAKPGVKGTVEDGVLRKKYGKKRKNPRKKGEISTKKVCPNAIVNLLVNDELFRNFIIAVTDGIGLVSKTNAEDMNDAECNVQDSQDENSNSPLHKLPDSESADEDQFPLLKFPDPKSTNENPNFPLPKFPDPKSADEDPNFPLLKFPDSKSAEEYPNFHLPKFPDPKSAEWIQVFPLRKFPDPKSADEDENFPLLEFPCDLLMKTCKKK